MNWCCVQFQNHYATAGEMGLSILVGRDNSGNPEFTLQCRAIDLDVQNIPITDFPITTVLDSRILFCPWCGRNLRKWYRKDIDALYRANLKISDI